MSIPTFNKSVCQFLLISIFCGIAAAQQVSVSTPFRGVSSQFNEQLGGASIGPAAAGQGIGFGAGAGGIQFKFRLFGEQGYSQNMSSVAPSLTMMNGYPATIFSGVQTPFVTGIVPVVGSGRSPVRTAVEQYGADEIRRRSKTANRKDAQLDQSSHSQRTSEIHQANSSAAHGDVSVEEIRRLNAARPTRIANHNAPARRTNQIRRTTKQRPILKLVDVDSKRRTASP